MKKVIRMLYAKIKKQDEEIKNLKERIRAIEDLIYEAEEE